MNNIVSVIAAYAATPVEIDMAAIYTIFALIVAGCSIAAFFFGRKREALEQGKREGAAESNLSVVASQIADLKKSIEIFTAKSDRIDAKRDEDNRQLLIAVTRLEQSYKSLHIRVDRLESQCRDNHLLHRKEESDR